MTLAYKAPKFVAMDTFHEFRLLNFLDEMFC